MKIINFLLLGILLSSCSKTRFEKLNSQLSNGLEVTNSNYTIQLKKMDFQKDTTTITYNIRILVKDNVISDRNSIPDIYITSKNKRTKIHPLLQEPVANGIEKCQEYICVFNAIDLYGFNSPLLVYNTNIAEISNIELNLFQ